MGLSWFSKFFGDPEVKILLLGLDAAGKTSILYKAKLDENVTTIPTIGFNVESIKYKNTNFIAWDVGGRGTRVLVKHYFKGVNAIIYVVDSTDIYRIEEASEELSKVMSDDELRNAKLLVLANKQDILNVMTVTEIIEKLKLNKIKQKWHIQTCSAKTGDGIFEGFEWLSTSIYE